MKHTSAIIKSLFFGGIIAACASAHATLLWTPDLSNGLANAGFTVPTQNPPNFVAEATDQDSQSYFGAADKDYIRLRKMTAVTQAITALGVISQPQAPQLSLTSFNFLLKTEGSGTLTLAMYTGASASSTDRVMELRFNQAGGTATTGRINNTADAFSLNQSVGVQIYHNNSEQTVQYLVGGTIRSLESGNYTVFLNGEAVLIDTSIGTGHGAKGNGQGVRSIGLTYFSTNTGEILIDDLSIGSFAPIPEPSHVGAALAVLSLGAALLLRNRKHAAQ